MKLTEVRHGRDVGGRRTCLSGSRSKSEFASGFVTAVSLSVEAGGGQLRGFLVPCSLDPPGLRGACSLLYAAVCVFGFVGFFAPLALEGEADQIGDCFRRGAYSPIRNTVCEVSHSIRHPGGWRCLKVMK